MKQLPVFILLASICINFTANSNILQKTKDEILLSNQTKSLLQIVSDFELILQTQVLIVNCIEEYSNNIKKDIEKLSTKITKPKQNPKISELANKEQLTNQEKKTLTDLYKKEETILKNTIIEMQKTADKWLKHINQNSDSYLNQMNHQPEWYGNNPQTLIKQINTKYKNTMEQWKNVQ